MAGARQEGPVCAYGKPVVVDDGTSCRAPSPRPGSVDSVVHRYFVTVGEFLDSDYQTLKASLQSTYQGLGRGLRSNYEGARCLYQACRRAEELAPGAVLRETGYELQSLLAGLIPGLLQMIVVVSTTTFLGAAIGGIVGFFFGGAGAVPGAAVGGEIGFDIGLAFLTWLGVAFLAVSIAKGFGEMVAVLQNGIDLAWRARSLEGPAEEWQVEQAAQELARAVGILVRLILQAIVVYLLKKAAVSATRGAMTTAGALRAEGAAAVSDATVAELVGRLRASKFGPGFADWVERNWRDLVKDPRLQETRVLRSTSGAGGAGSASAVDSSVAKPRRAPRPDAPEDATEPGPSDQPASKWAKDDWNAPRNWKYQAKQVGRTEPGAVPDNADLRAARLAAENRTAPNAPAGWPQMSDDVTKTFGADPQPINLPPGTKLYRVIDNDGGASGSYWSTDPPPSTEGAWRAGSAVKDGWNGDGGYVESTVPEGGLNAWSGPAAPQAASTAGSVLPGGQTQIWVPRNTVVPDAPPQPTPWNSGN